MTTIDVSPKDPLHQKSGPDMGWSLANTAEALPGVLTPLGWTFWQPQLNLAIRRSYYELGALSRSELEPSPDPLKNYGAIFCGRYTASVELIRDVADRMPGTSGDKIEAGVFGSVRPGVVSRATRRRYPIIAARLPATTLVLRKRLERHVATIDPWWRTAAFRPLPWPEGLAEERFRQAQENFRAVMVDHVSATFVANLTFGRIADLAKRSGGNIDDLVTGGGSLEEVSLLRDVLDVAEGRTPIDDLVRRHGYHGPRAGAIDIPSWREDPSTLRAYIETARRRGEADGGPEAMLASRAERSREATRAVLGDLPPWQRPTATLLVRAARTLLPLREVGKGAFLRTVDVVRAAARAKGQRLVELGILDRDDDVFHLTADEFLLPELPSDIRHTVAFRRERRDLYQTLDLPRSWIGDPEPFSIEGSAPVDREPRQQGIPVSDGVATGRVRVVHEPQDDELQPGEVLVCRATDPAWAPLLYTASALVTEIGGPLSHAAIIARELGIPGVVNLSGATAWLDDGDLVRVDGGTGAVERIDDEDTPEGANR